MPVLVQAYGAGHIKYARHILDPAYNDVVVLLKIDPEVSNP
jgi:hypothetical protein